MLPDLARAPGYARDAAGVGQVHIGLGAFHRAHQALYTDEALRLVGGDWRIVGASLRSAAAARELAAQDDLYTLIERGPGAGPPRVVGALAGALDATEADGYRHLLARCADPAVKIITITVTEKGYCQRAGELDRTHTDVVHDLRADARRRSLPGVLVAGLAARRAADAGPITVLSCDNLSGNGTVTAAVVDQFAARAEPGLAAWIAANVAFPSTMVDRIVPALDAADRDALGETLGYRDAAAVICEPFRQWVIEDRFAAQRPDWGAAGALFVADVAPFEAAKLRLLNGAHSAAAYLGRVLDLGFVHEVMADDDCRAWLQCLLREDVVPGVIAPAGFDVAAYVAAVLRRFANPEIPYTTLQVATDGSQKLRERWVPAIVDRLRAGHVPAQLAAAVALWVAHLDDPAPDPRGDALGRIAGRQPVEQVAMLFDLPTFSALADAPREDAVSFRDAVLVALQTLRSAGPRGLIAAP
ncbi:MAG: mannitol dehydrogenase family protein [Pseudomonadota bacterium]